MLRRLALTRKLFEVTKREREMLMKIFVDLYVKTPVNLIAKDVLQSFTKLSLFFAN